MLRTGWSWPELQALPDGYLEPLERVLQERDAQARAAARAVGGRRRR